MKVPDHIAKITEQVEAMRKDGHDKKPRVSILLDAIEYEAGAILEADSKKPKPFYKQ